LTAVPRVVHTIGHSTHPIATFIEMLDAHGIGTLADVRTVPKSRRNPQFRQDALARELTAAGIDYRYMKDLGGLRKTSKASVNGGWRNESFRGYADYMQTDRFEDALTELIALADASPTAIMCAEAVPWRCHRSLIGDALLIRGIDVVDIFSGAKDRPHTLTSFARVSGTEITYPPELAGEG
jgi:uncharacterized protein (DUF488 family)